MARGNFFYQGERFLLGQVEPEEQGGPPGPYGIWDDLDPDPRRSPVRCFPPDPAGWTQAWTWFSAWEPEHRPFEPATGSEHATGAQAGSATSITGGTATLSPPNPWCGAPLAFRQSDGRMHHAGAGKVRGRRGLSLASAGASLVLAASAIALALGSPQGNGRGLTGRQEILAAYAQTTAAKTAHMTMNMSMKMSIQGMSMNLSASGSADIDMANQVGSGSETASVMGMGITIKFVADGSTLYVQIPKSFMSAASSGMSLPSGVSWLSIPLGSVTGNCTSKGSMSSLGTGGPSDFSESLSYLQAISDSVTDKGSATVDGTSTTHYHATVDFSKIAGQAAGGCGMASSFLQQASQYGLTTIPVDVYIDGSNDVIRETIQTSMHLPAAQTRGLGQATVSVDATTDYSNFGEQVSATPPPANEVEPFSAIENQINSHIGSGGNSTFGASPGPNPAGACIASTCTSQSI